MGTVGTNNSPSISKKIEESKPLTEEELCRLISEANGGAEVKIIGFEEGSCPMDLATASADEIKQVQENKIKTSPELFNNLRKAKEGT